VEGIGPRELRYTGPVTDGTRPGVTTGLRVTMDFIGRDAFIRNKRATGRTKDLGDIEGL
jgi:hypothetical protein